LGNRVDNSHLYIIEDDMVMVLNKKEYLMYG
jgi:hypothetical protein